MGWGWSEFYRSRTLGISVRSTPSLLLILTKNCHHYLGIGG